MPDILDEIVASKRRELETARRDVSLDAIRNQATRADPPRDFYAAVTRAAPHGVHLIAEIKRQSPSAGLIRADFDPAAIARVYHDADASAISVLTDEPYFGGRLQFIAAVRDAVPLPVLRKDFVVDAYQVWQARAAGADAVLLITEVLGADACVELSSLCRDLNMAALIEAYNPDLLREVLDRLGRPIPRGVLIGINNRDLATQTIDLSTTAKLAAMMPDTSMLVAESGIRTQGDVRTVQQAGARAILVGEAIMSAPDMRGKIHEILGIGDR